MTDRPYVIRRFIDDGETDTICVISRYSTRLWAEYWMQCYNDQLGWSVDVHYDPDHLWQEPQDA